MIFQNQLLTDQEKNQLIPYQQAKLYHHRDKGLKEKSFEQLFREYIDYGHHVYSGPTAFFMMRGVPHRADLEIIRNPLRSFDEEDINCVFVEQAAGNLLDVWHNTPIKIRENYEFVVAERRGKPYVWRMARLKTLIESIKQV